MERKLNGKVVVFKTGDVSVICPQCGYYNKMNGVNLYGTCKRCQFVIDPHIKFICEIDKLLNFKLRERRRKRERRYSRGDKTSDIRAFKN